MENQYKKWHILKNDINNKKIDFFPKERDIWVTYVGKNIGYEQNGIDNIPIKIDECE